MKIAQLMLFWGLWYIAFTTRSLLSPFLPIIENELAINHATAGGLLFFTAAGGTLALLLTGYLALRVGYKRLIAWGFLLSATALLGLFYAHTYPAFAFFLFFFGMGGGFYLPCAIPILTAVFDREHWGKAISVHETAAGFCILTVPLLVSLGLGIMPWRYLFVVPAALFFMIVTVFWFTGPDPKPRQRSEFGISTVLRRGDFWVILILWTASGIGVMGIYNIVPLFLVHEKGMTLETSNLLLSLSRVGGVTGQIVIGFIMDRLKIKPLLAFLCIASGVSAIGLAVAQSQWLLAVMLVLQGTFCVVFFPVGIVAVSKLTQAEERTSFTGVVMAVAGVISLGIAPSVLGAIADVYTFQVGISLLGVGTLIVSPLVMALRDI